MVEQWGGSVIDVQGHPAYLDPGKPADAQYAELLLDIDGTLIRLLGDRTASAADLVRVANELDLSAPAQTF